MNKKNKNKFTIKIRDNLPNEMHFEVQLRTRAASFKNRKQYDRKRKHKDNQINSDFE